MVTKGKSNKPIKRRVYKRKIPVKKEEEKQKQTQNSRSVGNVVNIYEKPKRQYTRKQPPQSRGSGMPSIITQIHNLPLSQTPMPYMPNILGSNNIKSAELTGNLALVRQNEINNESGITVGGNKDNYMPSSADILKEKMTTPKQPKKTTSTSTTLKELNKLDDVPEGWEYQYFSKSGQPWNKLTKSGNVDRRGAEKRLVKIITSTVPNTPIKPFELTGLSSSIKTLFN